jgi:K(+)-stimulated pyrophosphate-energized sodium pump
MLYPLVIGACVITSIIGTFFVKLGEQLHHGRALQGLIIAGVLGWRARPHHGAGGGDTPFIDGTSSITGRHLFSAASSAWSSPALIVVITEYYTGTDNRPVNSISQASVTGHGTNVIQGLAMSLESTAFPALVIIGGIISTYQLGRPVRHCHRGDLHARHGRHDRGTRRLRSGHRQRRRHRRNGRSAAGSPRATDALDAVGNTTKAVTKGYAIGSAGLGALVLFAAYTERPEVLRRPMRKAGRSSKAWGRLSRCPTPTWWPACSSAACCRTCSAACHDGCRPCRRCGRGGSSPPVQGKAGHHGRHRPPDYGRAVDMLTKAAIKEMIVPSLLPVLAPLFVYFGVLLISGSKARPLRRSAPCCWA